MVTATLEPLYAAATKERQGERTDLKPKADIVADRRQSKASIDRVVDHRRAQPGAEATFRRAIDRRRSTD
jgi:hypothetical protein